MHVFLDAAKSTAEMNRESIQFTMSAGTHEIVKKQEASYTSTPESQEAELDDQGLFVPLLNIDLRPLDRLVQVPSCHSKIPDG